MRRGVVTAIVRKTPQERSLALQCFEPVQLRQLDIMVIVMITRSDSPKQGHRPRLRFLWP